jgi:hypothetical protein
MENYESKLLGIDPIPTERVISTIKLSDLMGYVSIRDTEGFKKAIQTLALKLPFYIRNWPGFETYVEDWFNVEVTRFRYNFYYCERGGVDLRVSCNDFIDAAFEVFKIAMPLLTRTAGVLAAKLDPIADQRLLIWLRMSSEIYHMQQINDLFGRRMAVANLAWMSEELVRMGVASDPGAAFGKKGHILKGLTLSGYPLEQADEIYNRMESG